MSGSVTFLVEIPKKNLPLFGFGDTINLKGRGFYFLQALPFMDQQISNAEMKSEKLK